MQIPGGTKFALTLLVLIVFLAVFVMLAEAGRLGEGIAAIVGGLITGTLTQFGLLNTANNKAALAAGKARDEERTALSGMSARDVLDRAGDRTGADVPGAVGAAADAGGDRLDAGARAVVSQLRGSGRAVVPDGARAGGDPADV
mgnify:CR=1 FL=1